MTGSPADPEVLAVLAAELAADVARHYRIDAAEAQRIILEHWRADVALQDQAAREPAAHRLKRTRAYKRAASAAKTRVYYGLRKYRQDEEGLEAGLRELQRLAEAGASIQDHDAVAARERIVTSHVSSGERLGDAENFFEALFALVPAPASVIDLGCGVQPLLYPFGGAGLATSRYLALDRDAKVIEVVNAWASLLGGDRLEARCWSMSDGFDAIVAPSPQGLFDLALALKFVPVLQRQERKSLRLLRRVPARLLLVTGSRQAMVKRRSIDRREERTLRAFAEEARLPVVGEFETRSERGLLLDVSNAPAD